MKLPSLTHETSWVWSGDPSLDAPVRKTGEKDKAWKDRLAEWHRRLDVARQTGAWDGVVKAGGKLTTFTVGFVPRMVWSRFEDLVRDNKVGLAEAMALAVRLGLRSVAELHDFEGQPFVVSMAHTDRFGECAKEDVLDLLDAYWRVAKESSPDVADPVLELGSFIVSRQRGVPPLSGRG